MIKDFKNFIKESVENKGKGPGNQDLIPNAPKKQTINRSIQTMDFLRVGKHILTKKIDGFVDSVQNKNVYISDRITGEIKKYTFKEILKEITGPKNLEHLPVEGFTGVPAWAKKQIIKEGLEQKKIQAIHTIENPEDEITDEDTDKIDDDVDNKIDEDEINFDEIKENYNKEELVGDIYNPGIKTESDEDEDEDDEEEKYQEKDSILRGTEDNPLGTNKRNKREMPNESWIKYWENFNKKQKNLTIEEEEEDEDLEDYINDKEEFEMEDEVENIIGSEDNPIDSRKRTKVEEYSEENPEPLPNETNLDDRYDQFEKQ